MGTLAAIRRPTGGKATSSIDPGELTSAMAQVFVPAHRPRR